MTSSNILETGEYSENLISPFVWSRDTPEARRVSLDCWKFLKDIFAKMISFFFYLERGTNARGSEGAWQLWSIKWEGDR